MCVCVCFLILITAGAFLTDFGDAGSYSLDTPGFDKGCNTNPDQSIKIQNSLCVRCQQQVHLLVMISAQAWSYIFILILLILIAWSYIFILILLITNY